MLVILVNIDTPPHYTTVWGFFIFILTKLILFSKDAWSTDQKWP